jgi:hypothetical protein
MAKTNPKNNGVQIPFDHHDGFIQKWQEWLQYRKERRLAAYTPTGLKATFTKLKRISNDDPGVAMQIIDQSLENSWQGLFELKPNSNAANISNTTNSRPKQGISGSRIQAAKDF